MNPADDISRGLTASELLGSDRWLVGPKFLLLSEVHWPELGSLAPLPDDDLEVKRAKEAVRSCAVNAGNNTILDRLISKHSSWLSLKRQVAWVIRAKDWLKAKSQGGTLPDMKGPLTVGELNSAERDICKYVQGQTLQEELNSLKENLKDQTRVPVKKTSPLYKFSPVLTDEGLIRVGGRLKSAPVDVGVRHPIVLPKEHHIVNLIVRHYHEVSGHAGREYVLSLIQERFWLIRARSSVRKMPRECLTCKRLFCKPEVQKMADLPHDRVTPSKPPFTFVGVDYFGPVMIKVGRSQVKRYGCIFTCLAIRAIHIEVSSTLETDSFINALQRFVSRRGLPEEIRSDNGTNFVGAAREIGKLIQNWNQKAIHSYLLQREVNWKFNTPCASHAGGVWERQIRTVRKVMSSVVKEQVLDEEGLATLMCNVESIVNGRPITTVPDEVRDLEPLTPNHLLLLRASTPFLHDEFDRKDSYSRKRWRRINYLSDLFWKRWTREYLPTLQRRQKWVESSRSVRIGDIVLTLDEVLPRNSWLLGKVVEVYKGNDGLVRTAKIKTKSSTLMRPVNKICLLESVENIENASV